MAKKRVKKDSLPEGARLIARNKRATYDFEIDERFEAGLVLVGSEVKSLRAGHATLNEAFIIMRRGEAFLLGCQIKEYAWANLNNHDPLRERKLLLNAIELEKIDKRVSQKGFTLVPIALYFKGSRVKLEFGVGRGKREFEKRDAKAAAEAKREMDRAMKR